MEKEPIEELFKKLQNQFDFEEPHNGHESRFLEKLKQPTAEVKQNKKKFNIWMPLSIAASLALVFVLSKQILMPTQSIKEQVVEIAPEASNTEFYFTSLVEEQINLLEAERTPVTDQLVDDTLEQLQKLEKDYQKLEKELVNGGNSKLILNAMIINFETRITLVKEVLTTIEDIKNLNEINDANITI
ncbi:hypothetical protein [Croceivirga radicis]|uniref:hypothetical protein n=1 Tax=Croceivirga radicis TaxID=1929488 RepID=UPI000255AB7B|nr:hypothetical protein [Croceivirga radicis]